MPRGAPAPAADPTASVWEQAAGGEGPGSGGGEQGPLARQGDRFARIAQGQAHTSEVLFVVLHYATLCYTVLCCAPLCYTMLHCAMLSYATPGEVCALAGGSHGTSPAASSATPAGSDLESEGSKGVRRNGGRK